MDLMKPTIKSDGMHCDHNMPCPIHGSKLAVLQSNTGVFLPSWKAQDEGWMLVKVPKWMKRILKKYVPGNVRFESEDIHTGDEPEPMAAQTVEKLFCLAVLQEGPDVMQRVMTNFIDYRDRSDEVMADIERGAGIERFDSSGMDKDTWIATVTGQDMICRGTLPGGIGMVGVYEITSCENGKYYRDGMEWTVCPPFEDGIEWKAIPHAQYSEELAEEARRVREGGA